MNKKRSRFMMYGLSLLTVVLLMASPVTAYASNTFTPPTALTQPTPEQQRYQWYYNFESGMYYLYDLGRPTTYYGVVSQDVMTANVRRDANVSFRPPGARTGNTITPTDPSNWAFNTQPNHQNQLQQNGFWFPIEHFDTNGLPMYDTTQQGVNSPQGTLVGIYESFPTDGASVGGSGGFLPPTSINGE